MPYNWTPPVQFYFQVEFQLEGGRVIASFSEVDGLVQELVCVDHPQHGDNVLALPERVKVGDIVLKRALEPLTETVNSWMKDCFDFHFTGWIAPCTLIISLMGEDRQPVASWECKRAIPIKWSLGSLNASESKLSIETLTLKYTCLKRIL